MVLSAEEDNNELHAPGLKLSLSDRVKCLLTCVIKVQLIFMELVLQSKLRFDSLA